MNDSNHRVHSEPITLDQRWFKDYLRYCVICIEKFNKKSKKSTNLFFVVFFLHGLMYLRECGGIKSLVTLVLELLLYGRLQNIHKIKVKINQEITYVAKYCENNLL